MLTVKRLTGVAPEVDVIKHITPLPIAKKSEPALALKATWDVTRNKKKGYRRTPNRTRVCVCENM